MKIKQMAVGLLAGMSVLSLFGMPAFADEAGRATVTIEGKTVSVPTKGNSWININGYQHFVKDGNLIKGWKYFTKDDGQNIPHFSFFDTTNGRLYTGWHVMGAKEGEKNQHVSYFGNNGWLRTGWQEMGTANNPDNKNAKHWSYFGGNGWLRTGWQQMGTKNNPDGKNKVHFSYFGDNGWLRTGWQKMGKGTGNPDGNSAVHYSYFGSDGWLRTGWQQLGKGTGNSFGENSAKHISYFGADGWLRTGWQEMGTANNPDNGNAKHLSYFGSNGWLTTGSKRLGNAEYAFNAGGWVTGTRYSIQKVINQRNTGFGSMGCGGAAGTMAMQANGFNKNIQPGNYYNFFFGSVARNNDSRYGWNGSNGIWNPALTDWIKLKTSDKAARISGNNVNVSTIKDALIHGQTVVALVPSGSITHWITVYGFNNNTFYIADPWGSSANAASGQLYTLSGSVLESRLNDAANRKGRVCGEYTKEGVKVGEYRLP